MADQAAPGGTIEGRAKEPKGSLPENLGNKLATGLLAVIVAAILLSSAWNRCSGPPEGPPPAALEEPLAEPPDASAPREAAAGVAQAAADEARRQADARRSLLERETARREALASEQRALAASQTAREAAVAEAEAQIAAEETLRRHRALSAHPVALTTRPAPAGAPEPAPPAAPAPAPDPLAAAASSLDRALAAALEGAAAPPAPPPAPAPPTVAPPPPPAVPVAPRDPPGWDRIYEGEVLEAVLQTQLRGDFPGPVAALVAAPLRSRDRQRVLVPAGARALGEAAAVSGPDQARLAVSFDRLVLPDGRWLDLPFRGLSQAGESGLKDRVNNHYLSTFGAAAAVGVLSGFALSTAPAGAGFGSASLGAGAGRGTADAGMRIFDRLLSRLPTITIRAGHRLRIWFTSDVLVPPAAADRRGEHTMPDLPARPAAIPAARPLP